MVEQAGRRIAYKWEFNNFHLNIVVKAGTYHVNKDFKLTVYVATYVVNFGQDYTVKSYSKPAFHVKDKDGKTNMVHMDGQEPSGFKKSKW